MTNLTTQYMGLILKNPVIVASSGLVDSVDGVKQCEVNQAGAVVLKSLFEEQINLEAKHISGTEHGDLHPEAYDFIQNTWQDFGEQNYINLVKNTKKSVNIPVIASINCITPSEWKDFASKLENAGADAIELNISFMPSNPSLSVDTIHQQYFDIVELVKHTVSIPIAVKVGPFFTNMAWFAKNLYEAGADGLVLFNRFYQFDIDINRIKVNPGNSLSSETEMNVSLRWMAILSGESKLSLSASTGIHNYKGAIKHLLAGADTVQLCSALYKNGVPYINTIISGIEQWMEDKHFKSLSDFKGRLSQTYSNKPMHYERLQYMKALGDLD